MEENAYLTSIAAGAFYLFVGARLLRLSRRTRKRPELQLGLYFALSGLFYVGYNLPSLLRIEDWPPLLSVAVEWTYIVGVFPYLFFIRSVFRPDATWARWLVGLCSILVLGGTAMVTAEGHVEYALDNPWFLAQWVGYTAPCMWLACEAHLYGRGARKRARIGLCAPIVANRYRLLAIFGALQVLACLGDLSLVNEVSGDQAISLFSDAVIGGAEIASVATLWLAFFPPLVYTTWVERRTAILPTPMDG